MTRYLDEAQVEIATMDYFGLLPRARIRGLETGTGSKRGRGSKWGGSKRGRR
jgi:hypothetical protein